MCQSKAQGGQRCYGHTQTRMVAAQAAYDRTGDQVDQDYLIGTQVEFASTRQGEQDIRDQIDAVSAAGQHEQAGLLAHVLRRGQILGDTNRELARLHRARIAHDISRDESHEARRVHQDLHAALATQDQVMDLTDLHRVARTAATATAVTSRVGKTQPVPARRSLFRRSRQTAQMA